METVSLLLCIFAQFAIVIAQSSFYEQQQQVQVKVGKELKLTLE